MGRHAPGDAHGAGVGGAAETPATASAAVPRPSPRASSGGRASVPAPTAAAASVPVAGAPSSPAGSAAVPVSPGFPPGPPPGFPADPRGSRPPGGPPYGPPPRLDRYGRPIPPVDPRKLRKRRRIRKILLFSLLALLLLAVGGMGAAYAAVQVPLPNPKVMKQISYVYYADGTEMARLGIENREEVKIKDIPKHVQRAVVAAEDRSFWSNEGISIKGIMRALWANVTGDEVQGASTITQQYVKNAFLTQDRTFSRKMKELVLAVKMDNEYSKDEIMEYYLNTIYFGRGAYGIQAAAKAYFNTTVDKVTPEQAAFMAGVIKSPSDYEPELNADGATERWRYVLSAMKDEGWYKGKPSEAAFPQFRPKAEVLTNSSLQGATGTLMNQVARELKEKGISEQMLTTGGLRVTTTIDSRAQRAMEEAVNQVMQGQPDNLQAASVAVEPNTGKVLAYYGGSGGYGFNDYAGADLPHPPGSSFKPYVLAAALEDGIGVKSEWDGSSPQEFRTRPGKPVSNSENENSCRRCDLDRSTVLSLNTVYYALAEQLTPQRVAETAQRAGITEIEHKPVEEIKGELTENIGLGVYPVSVLEQAAGFATFGANGKYAAPHFVTSVTQASEPIYTAKPIATTAFSDSVAADSTYVMEHVVEAGGKLNAGRRAAGKTGTHQYLDTGENSHAWMSGYTPQIATATWIGNKGDDGPIKNKAGRSIWGSGEPSQIWRAFMNKAHETMSLEKKPFPKAPLKGDTRGGNAPAAPSPSATVPTDPDEQPLPFPTDQPTSPPLPGRPGRNTPSPSPTPFPNVN